ncbi:MAG: hypothetical protein KGJ80_14655, partial [Chloroflexota bacterium]|nr:hypothetical protein [Chloroflexota bacterium]
QSWSSMTASDILARINAFPYWHYAFDLNGHPTPVSAEMSNRHFQRKAHDDLMLYPTKQAVLEIAQRLGYRTVVLKSQRSNYLGAEDYQSGERRAFVCAKQTNLTNLAAEIETRNT